MKVVGYLRIFSGVRCLIAFRIHRVEDMNEITFHNAHAAYVHLFYEKGQAAQHQAQNVPAAAMGNADSPLAQRVQEFLKSRGQGVATSLADIRGAFADVSAHDVQAAVKWLSDEGWIFTAGDEDHYTVGGGM